MVLLVEMFSRDYLRFANVCNPRRTTLIDDKMINKVRRVFMIANVRPWIFRALSKGVVFSVIGVTAGVLLPFAIAWLSMTSLPGQKGASPEDASRFLSNLHPNYWGFPLLLGLMCFFAGISSTPPSKVGIIPKTDKYKIMAIGVVANLLLPPFFGPLVTGQGYFECLPVGLFLGVPLAVVVSSHFYDRGVKRFGSQAAHSKDEHIS